MDGLEEGTLDMATICFFLRPLHADMDVAARKRARVLLDRARLTVWCPSLTKTAHHTLWELIPILETLAGDDCAM